MWHRRARKTATALTKITTEAFLRKGAYWHVFPTFKEGKDAVFMDPTMLDHVIPPELIERRYDREGIIKFINGSIYLLKGGNEPDSLRGAGPVGIVLDEFATMKLAVWQTLEPIVRANGGWCWFVGTPSGQNHLYKFWQLGLSGNPEWRSWILKASQSGVIPQDQLREARSTAISESFYTQEFECEWLEGEGKVFKGVRDVLTAEPMRKLDGHNYVCGVDLAKHVDWTVVSVYDRANNNQVYQDRFQRIDWPFQKAKIKAVSDLFNKALVVLDATGLGDPIYDDLASFGVPVEPIKINEQTKKELIQKLSIFIQQRRIKMINIQDTLFEFDNFTYEIGPTGRIKYGAPEGYHDDIVISHALAVHGLFAINYKAPEPEKTRIQKAYERAIMGEAYEQRLAEVEWANDN